MSKAEIATAKRELKEVKSVYAALAKAEDILDFAGKIEVQIEEREARVAELDKRAQLLEGNLPTLQAKTKKAIEDANVERDNILGAARGQAEQIEAEAKNKATATLLEAGDKRDEIQKDIDAKLELRAALQNDIDTLSAEKAKADEALAKSRETLESALNPRKA